jgi:hypothetical protein
VAAAPSVTWFSFTSGVPPIDSELSAKNLFIGVAFPIQITPILFPSRTQHDAVSHGRLAGRHPTREDTSVKHRPAAHYIQGADHPH